MNKLFYNNTWTSQVKVNSQIPCENIIKYYM